MKKKIKKKSSSLMANKEEWDIWNSILNALRQAKGKQVLSKEYNPYLHSKHEKVIVINPDVLRKAIKLKFNDISVFAEDIGIGKNYVQAALGGRPLTKNALNNILMRAEVSYKNIEIKEVV